MTKREPKDKIQIPTRATRPKGDMFRNLRKPEEVESLSIEELVSSPTTTHHPPPTTHQPSIQHPIAPERNFARVANSVNRDAIQAGLFKGESKKLYDALYLRTRGAVVPRRTIRVMQSDLMDWARVSHNTLKAHIKHLSKVGLLKVHYVRGDNTGAEYEVFLPEEVAPPTTHHPPGNHPPPTTQNLGPPTTQNLVGGGGGYLALESTTSDNHQTFFKTKNEIDDDEAFAGSLRAAARELTGKEPTAEEWNTLFEFLTTELRIAAARTTVSNVPAFLTEHLRRRLWKREKGKGEIEVSDKEELSPSLLTPEQVKACPDCGGTGFYYPTGYEGGVAKCKHEKLAV